MAETVSIIVAHSDDATRSTLVQAVDELKYSVQAAVDSKQALIAECARNRPGLIISGIDMPDGNAIDALIEISKDDPLPAIIVTDNESLRDVEHALRDHVMAYLIEPIDSDQIQPTIYLVLRRFEQFEALHEEVQDLRQTLVDRKVIERAKGILMSQGQLDESEAFRRLQKMASDKRTKLVKIADAIITAQEALSD